MFPKAVQTLIETYAQDMQLLLEMKRLKYDGHMKKVIQLGDEATEWLMEFNAHHNVDLEIDNRRALKMVLKAGLMDFMKSPAGFVHRKIAYQEQKRQDLWKSIGVTPTTTLGKFQCKIGTRQGRLGSQKGPPGAALRVCQFTRLA